MFSFSSASRIFAILSQCFGSQNFPTETDSEESIAVLSQEIPTQETSTDETDAQIRERIECDYRQLVESALKERAEKLWQEKKMVEITEQYAETFKKTQPEFYNYVKQTFSSKKNRVLMVLDEQKIQQLLNAISPENQTIDWSAEIFSDEDFPYITLGASFKRDSYSVITPEQRVITAEQRSTLNHRYYAIKKFGKDKVKTYPMFDAKMEFTEEALTYLKYYYDEDFLTIDKESLKQAFKVLELSEKYFMVIDASDYIHDRSKKRKTMFMALHESSVICLKIKEDANLGDQCFYIFIHMGALQKFNQLLFKNPLKMEFSLGFSDAERIYDEMLNGKRIVYDWLPEVEKLKWPHNFRSPTLTTAGHDVFHTAMASSLKPEFRVIILQNIRSVMKIVKNYFNHPAFGDERTVEDFFDLNLSFFYRNKLNRLETNLAEENSLFLKICSERFARIFTAYEHNLWFALFLAADIYFYQNTWLPVSAHLHQIKFTYIKNFVELVNIVQEELNLMPEIKNCNDVRLSIILLKSFFRYLQQFKEDHLLRELFSDIARKTNIIINRLPNGLFRQTVEFQVKLTSMNIISNDQGQALSECLKILTSEQQRIFTQSTQKLDKEFSAIKRLTA